MRIRQILGVVLCFSAIHALGQQILAPEPQAATMIGTVVDTDGGVIPGAAIVVSGPTADDRHASVSTGDGSFTVNNLRPAVSYEVFVTAKGFADLSSAAIVLSPGQQLDLREIKLTVGAVVTSVTAVDAETLAVEQVKNEEQQRVLGIFPNFYTVYDQRFVPLSASLKLRLALRASTDVATVGSAGILAGINQAAGTRPDYVQGAKGFGQRFGAAYAGGVTDILIGGALLPSLLHQDPRYFYQGTGTKKSRAFHAMSAPFVARGDDGRREFNYSSIGGDLASGALSNLYFPNRDRGPGLVFDSALTSIGGRIVNALAQEFILSKFTSRGKNKD